MYQFPQLYPGNNHRLCAGVFDYGATPYPLPSGPSPDKPVEIEGEGIDVTILSGSACDAMPGCMQFPLGNIILKNLTLYMPYRQIINGIPIGGPAGDCAVTGFQPQAAGLPAFKAILDHVKIVSPSWGLYHWADDPASVGPTMEMYDSIVHFGRFGIAAANSGLGQNFSVYRTKFIGDASMSYFGGAVSAPIYGGVIGFYAKGGLSRLIDCEMCINGGVWPSGASDPANQVYLPRCCAVTDNQGTGYPPAGNARLEIRGLISRLNPNGATFCYDLDVPYLIKQLNAVNLIGAMSGRASNGGLTYSPGVAA